MPGRRGGVGRREISEIGELGRAPELLAWTETSTEPQCMYLQRVGASLPRREGGGKGGERRKDRGEAENAVRQKVRWRRGKRGRQSEIVVRRERKANPDLYTMSMYCLCSTRPRRSMKV